MVGYTVHRISAQCTVRYLGHRLCVLPMHTIKVILGWTILSPRARWVDATNKSRRKEFQPHLRVSRSVKSCYGICGICSTITTRWRTAKWEECSRAVCQRFMAGHRQLCLLQKQVSGRDPTVRARDNKQSLHWNVLCIWWGFSYTDSAR